MQSDDGWSEPALVVGGGTAATAATGQFLEDSSDLATSAGGGQMAAPGDDSLLRKDARYRKYCAGMDRILSSFDAVNEWADVIGFLAKLIKILQLHQDIPLLPRKLLVAKRLAQCLNPALPTGVHQKTLEVYFAIFEAIGHLQLAEDLQIYSYGLFPFLQHAAMSIKPLVLTIYDRFYLPLGLRLKPCLKGLVIALLPALEEEGNEFFEPSLKMLDCLAKSVGQGYFFHCMWLALISVPHLRGATLSYLLRRLPKITSAEDVAVVLGDNLGLLARAISASLGDKNLLVQRSCLELLVVNFPLKNNVFRDSNLQLVIRSALTVVLRKDMSLNRRLYAWLASSVNTEMELFTQHALVAAARDHFPIDVIDAGAVTDGGALAIATLTRPYKIMISLLDKADVGQYILDKIFLDIVSSLKSKCDCNGETKTELLQTANMFFSMIDPFTMWRQFFFLICPAVLSHENSATSPLPDVKNYELLRFAIDNLKWEEDEETRRIHFPIFLSLLLWQIMSIKKSQKSFSGNNINPNSTTTNTAKIRFILSSCLTLFERIPDHEFSQNLYAYKHRGIVSIKSGDNDIQPISPDAFIQQVRVFYSDNIFEEYMAERRRGSLSAAESVISTEPLSSPLLPPTATASNNNIEQDQQFFPVQNDSALLYSPGSQSPGSPSSSFTLQVGRTVATVVLGQVRSLIAEAVLQSSTSSSSARTSSSPEYLEILCILLRKLTNGLGGYSNLETPSTIDDRWVMALMECAQSPNFFIVNTSLTTLIDIFPGIDPPIATINPFVTRAVTNLWRFLAPEFVQFHLRAAQLIWLLCGLSQPYIVENTITEILSAYQRGSVHELNNTTGSALYKPQDEELEMADFHKFGIFWKISDENIGNCSAIFSRPLFIILDTLRSESPFLRWNGESWCRMYLKSFARILKPLLDILFGSDVSIDRISYSIKLLGGSIVESTTTNGQDPKASSIAYSFAHADNRVEIFSNVLSARYGFNGRQLLYVFETLNAIFKVGDGMFLTNIWVRRFADVPSCQWMEADYNLQSSSLSEGEWLLLICLRYLEMDFDKRRLASQTDLHAASRDVRLSSILNTIHVFVADFIGTLILSVKPEQVPGLGTVRVMKDVIVRKLILAIHNGRIDLQWRLLQILKSISQNIARHISVDTAQSASALIGSAVTGRAAKTPHAPPPHPHALSANDTIPKTRSHPELRKITTDSLSTTAAPPASKKPLSVVVGNDISEITSTSPLFVKAMEEAISDSKNRTALQFWIDFIVSSLPTFRSSFDRVLIPVIHVFYLQLWGCCAKMKAFKTAAISKDEPNPDQQTLNDFSSERTSLETDFDMMLLALEKILIFGLSDLTSSDDSSDKNVNGGDRNQWFLSDYVSTILLIDPEGTGSNGGTNHPTPTISANSRDQTLNLLPQLFELLTEVVSIFDLGRSLSSPPQIDDSLYYDILESVASPSSSSLKGLLSKETAAFGLKYMGNKIQFRIQRLLDSIYRIYPADVIETIIEVWLKSNYDEEREMSKESVSEAIVRVLSLISDCSDRNVLVTVIDSLRSRTGNKMKRLVYRSTFIHENKLIIFLEWYILNWTSSDCVAEVWPNVLIYAKDYLANVTAFKPLFPFLFRLLSAIFKKLRTTSYFEGKKVKKDAEEIYQKVCDYCILICGRSFEQGFFRRNVPNLDGSNSDLTEGASSSSSTVNSLSHAPSQKKSAAKISEERLILYVLSNAVRSELRKNITDQDKINGLIANFVYYMINPGLRGKKRIYYTLALDILCSISSIPFSYKSWKKEIWDFFNEPKFFAMDLTCMEQWKTVIHVMMSNEQEKFTELLARVTAVQSTSLFVSREQEVQIRACVVRRVSFLLFAAPTDYYLKQLPTIQEKLVELLKGPAGLMHVEAFLCLRILFFRVSTHHLSNLWPVVLTDMIKMFSVQTKPPTPDRSDEQHILYSVCKFLDLLLILNIEEFQWHEWIFITDTLEVLNELVTNKNPVAFIDRLSEKWRLNKQEKLISLADVERISEGKATSSLRQPLLMARFSDDKSELLSFIQNLSRRTFDATFSLAKPDLDAITDCLSLDLVDFEQPSGGGSDRASSPSLLTEII